MMGELDTQLAALREASRGLVAPPGVRAAVMAAFRRRAAARRRSVWAWGWMPVAAALLLMAVATRPRAAREEAVLTGFVAWPYGPLPSERETARLVRASVPRRALMVAGFNVSPERAAEPVEADFLIGEDGLVKAVRFVR